jgi:hypothetical protein
LKLVLTVLSMFLQLATEASPASSLRNYESRVKRAAEEIARVKADPDYADEAESVINRLLPSSERVDIEGQEVTVNNVWLHVLLDTYGSEPDTAKRRSLLGEAEARLRTLDAQLVTLEEGIHRDHTAASSGADQVDAKREQLRRVLERPEYLRKPDDPIANFIKRTKEKIGNFLIRIGQRLSQLLFGAGDKASAAFIAIVIVGLAIAVFFVVRLGIRLRKHKKKKGTATSVLGEEVEAGVSYKNLVEEALQAARAGDFRAGIRKLYIALLFELAERNLVELEPGLTNRQYFGRLAGIVYLAEPMRYLTDRFDYFWYGMFPMTDNDFRAYLARYAEASEGVRKSAQPSLQ